MLLLLQDKNDVSRLHARRLIRFSSEGYLLLVFHAFVHVHLQDLYLLHHFLPLALFTAVFLTDHLTYKHTHTYVLYTLTADKTGNQFWLTDYIQFAGLGFSFTGARTFTTAVSADRLHLLDHARSQLSDHNAHTTPPAGRTLLHCASLPSLAANTQKTKLILFAELMTLLLEISNLPEQKVKLML